MAFRSKIPVPPHQAQTQHPPSAEQSRLKVLLGLATGRPTFEEEELRHWLAPDLRARCCEFDLELDTKGRDVDVWSRKARLTITVPPFAREMRIPFSGNVRELFVDIPYMPRGGSTHFAQLARAMDRLGGVLTRDRNVNVLVIRCGNVCREGDATFCFSKHLAEFIHRLTAQGTSLTRLCIQGKGVEFAPEFFLACSAAHWMSELMLPVTWNFQSEENYSIAFVQLLKSVAVIPHGGGEDLSKGFFYDHVASISDTVTLPDPVDPLAHVEDGHVVVRSPTGSCFSLDTTYRPHIHSRGAGPLVMDAEDPRPSGESKVVEIPLHVPVQDLALQCVAWLLRNESPENIERSVRIEDALQPQLDVTFYGDWSPPFNRTAAQWRLWRHIVTTVHVKDRIPFLQDTMALGQFLNLPIVKQFVRLVLGEEAENMALVDENLPCERGKRGRDSQPL